MKYYIPTSSLNFDNILQSECISPPSFYSRRKSGSKFIEVLEEIRGLDQLVLFRYPVSFTINDPSRYNFPLLIEIEDESQIKEDKLNKLTDGVYSFDSTIYLTPANCRFFFYSMSDYKLATITSKDNKQIKFYQNYIIFPTVSFPLLRDIPKFKFDETLSPLNIDENVFDKIKGSLFFFLLGQVMSVSPQIALQEKLTQEIYDIVSSILSNFSKSEMLRKRLNFLLEDFRKVDETEQDNLKQFYDFFDCDIGDLKHLRGNLISLLKKWDVWDELFYKLSRKWGVNFLPLSSALKSRDDYKKLISEIERRTQTRINKYKSISYKKYSLDLIENNEKGLFIKGHPLLSIAVNYIIDNTLKPEYLSACKDKICFEMIIRIKNYYISQKGVNAWNGGPKLYFNQLYSHIINIGEHFDVHSINDPEISSIAAFLLKGQRIDSYFSYLKMNNFSDYSYPLVLCGALFGYMDTNKDVLSNVLSLDFYETVYKKLFGKNMYKAKWDSPKDYSVQASEVDSIFKENKSNLNHVSFEDIVSTNNWKKELLDYANKNAIKQNRKRLLLSLQLALDENKDNTDYFVFFNLLKKYDGWILKNKKPSMAWKKMQEKFCPYFFCRNSDSNEQNTKERKLINGEYDNKSEPQSAKKNFINDVQVENVINEFSLIPVDLKDKILRNFRDFRRKCQSSECSYNAEYKSNSYFVNNFFNWCLSSENENAILNSIENVININELKNYLLAVYKD